MKNNILRVNPTDSVASTFYFDNFKPLKESATNEELETAMNEANEEYELLKNHYSKKHGEIVVLLDGQYDKIKEAYKVFRGEFAKIEIRAFCSDSENSLNACTTKAKLEKAMDEVTKQYDSLKAEYEAKELSIVGLLDGSYEHLQEVFENLKKTLN